MRVRQRDAARYPLRPLREERAIQPPVSAGQGEFTIGHMHSYDSLLSIDRIVRTEPAAPDSGSAMSGIVSPRKWQVA